MILEQWQLDIIEEARSWEGTPFSYGCSEKGKGTDCARFLLSIFKKFGYIRPGHQLKHLPPDWCLAKEPDASRFENIFVSQLYALADDVPIDEMRVSDILLMEYYGYKSHVGLLFPDDRMIHTRNQRKVQIQSIGNFRSRICAVLRCKGLPA